MFALSFSSSLAPPHKRAERNHINFNSHSCITHANVRAHAHNIVSAHVTRRFMLGMMCASVAAATMVGGATFYGMPVSTTHAVVGAVIGFSFVRTTDGLIWFKGSSGLGPVMMSWVVSPLFAGIVAAVLYTAFRKFCFQVSFLTHLYVFHLFCNCTYVQEELLCIVTLISSVSYKIKHCTEV